jgi:hypothetical protein
MHRIGYYHSSVEAHLRASYLRENGIMAGVIDGSVSAVTAMYSGIIPRGSQELVITSKSMREEATLLVEEFDANPPRIDDDWENNIQPDLSLLAEKHVPQCPSCDIRLCKSRPWGPCLGCKMEYNMEEIVFEQFGPEALTECFETTEPLANYTDEEVCEIPLDCPSCSYSLVGLPISGSCPECGVQFHRRELFVRILGS